MQHYKTIDLLSGSLILLNSGKTTNFMYKVIGDVTEEDMLEINNIEGPAKIRVRTKSIKEKGFSLQFEKVSYEIFELNLQVIDSRMPDILANLLKYYYSGRGSKMKRLLQLIKSENPCNFNGSLGHNFYEYKVKNFMRDVALGMTPSKMWDGYDGAGYKVIYGDREIIYHIYNDNEFQDYLLHNTRFVTPSSSRHEYGKVYQIGNQYFINLNLEIRFV